MQTLALGFDSSAIVSELDISAVAIPLVDSMVVGAMAAAGTDRS
jgi:hypothetical protein